MSNASSGLLFAHIVDGFKFMVKKSTDHAAELILYEVKAQSLRYRSNVSWAESDAEEKLRPKDDLSPEALGMFQSLSANLTSFCQRLRPSLVAQVNFKFLSSGPKTTVCTFHVFVLLDGAESFLVAF